MKKFFGEFKKFITRGNIVDMAVGVIVGSSFTAIVNALSNNVLKPIINKFLSVIMGKDALTELFTFLERVDKKDEAGNVITDNAGNAVADLENSIYIDWGAFIAAIINFIIIALVLFCIVKAINKMREDGAELEKKRKKRKISKEDRKALKALGIKLRDKEAVEAYFAEKKAAEEKAKKEAEEEAEAAAKAEAEAERLANPSTEDLLKLILAELQSKK